MVMVKDGDGTKLRRRSVWLGRGESHRRKDIRKVAFVSAICSLLLCYYGLIWKTQYILDDHLENHNVMGLLESLQIASVPPLASTTTRYIIFRPMTQYQGMGNILHGLLSAHLLGLEFGRVVCVASDWNDFHDAFQSVQTRNDCASLPPKGTTHLLSLVNFAPPPNECELRDLLASSTERIIYMTGNTYPRWPIIPPNFFAQYYQPTPLLWSYLPWKKSTMDDVTTTKAIQTATPPTTVVHLRQPDGSFDQRRGLDSRTLQVLGKTLPSSTFLVTNNVDWYTYFAKNFGWRHPAWQKVIHSAFPALEWGSTSANSIAPVNVTQQELSLQLFSDWYTILNAKHVYHTHSDFSLSAIHWNNIPSQTIMGLDDETGELQFTEESWREDGETPRLVDRTAKELRLCLMNDTLWEDVDFSDIDSLESLDREENDPRFNDDDITSGGRADTKGEMVRVQ